MNFREWLRNKPLLGYRYPGDYVADVLEMSRKLCSMIGSLPLSSDERRRLEQAQSYLKSALLLFEDAQRSLNAVW
ncbi:MAG: hypothetical protein ABSF24_02395 [Candidatus Bathyarchaeia archaeon]|jgi:hypothetical protein